MNKSVNCWFSPNLNRDMNITGHGYYGYALLLFLTSDSEYPGNENSQIIDCISNFINNGTVKAYTVNSFGEENRMKKNVSASETALLQQSYNKYIESEVVSFINKDCGGNVPIIVCGASTGAYLAVNAFFRRPDLFEGVIGMSGNYDLRTYTGGYFDDNCYFNSPVDFLPNLTDERILRDMHSKNIILACGQGENENSAASQKLSAILNVKKINHWLDIWGSDMNHDWFTWQKMLPYFLENINV